MNGLAYWDLLSCDYTNCGDAKVGLSKALAANAGLADRVGR
jgi:hypothetical protein